MKVLKQNGNNKVAGDYYLGLDVGSNSAGWAVTDTEYNVQKFKGKSMWGARLFEEASTAKDRRTHRSERRRIARRKQRLLLLDSIFEKEITKIDPNFFARMQESNLWADDKTVTDKFLLFNDKGYTDKDYLKQYPSIYHLRADLIHNPEKHDIRLVYLALHHLIKYRGHFVYANAKSENGIDLDESINKLTEWLIGNEITFEPADYAKFKEVLIDASLKISLKKIELKKAFGKIDDSSRISIKTLLELLSGAKKRVKDLIEGIELDDEKLSICFNDDLDEKLDELSSVLGDDIELILILKEVFDVAKLKASLGEHKYISDAKIDLFEKNKKDLKQLKQFIKEYHPEDYKKVFNLCDDKNFKCNYAVYSKYKNNETCKQEEFCKFLKGRYLEDLKKTNNNEYIRIAEEIEAGTFLTKLRTSENSIIPYQIHKIELEAILENASKYLEFLNEETDNLTYADKIKSIFTFKLPYYIGPLNKKSEWSWVIRKDEKIYPWNYKDVIDVDKTAQEFMDRLKNRCSYTNDPVLPMDSLLYSRYSVLNEINPLKVNGKSIPVEVKQSIYIDLFENSKKKVTKKSIYTYLLKNGHIQRDDQISGVDNELTSNLKSFHDFKMIIDSNKCTMDGIENIIHAILVYSDDRKMLSKWLKNNIKTLEEKDIKYLSKLTYKKWGRFSKTFLTEIYSINPEDGEAINIIDALWNTNYTIMELLNKKEFHFSECLQEYRDEMYAERESIHDALDDMYVSPSAKRSIWQTLRIVDEIVDIKKSAPKKIFIEMARDSSKAMKGKRTQSRKESLLKLYEACKKDSIDLYDKSLHEKLKNETDTNLRRDKLYLYYTQMGRSMYTGKIINFDLMMKDNLLYDIDHIYPRSKIKDDSITNRVLVEKTINENDKKDIYPIDESTRMKMTPFWKILKDKNLINDEKYKRLTRNFELTEEELSSFVARQLNVTQQSTKALATLLSTIYPTTKIVYSKAGNVSEFRHGFDLIKCREINDLHHAYDAYLNIVVGNAYDTKFTEKFFLNIRKEKYSLKQVF
ncbi:MAG: type II CRISPR RNA-guided endonuclease Cas9, partial [Bulleidia sp.]|nr:type II CRISPR RNA-guided endonuclease Cas9 [Bulleidia sp.]